MTEDRGTLRAIAWQEAFPGLRLFAALRLALRFRALLLAAVGISVGAVGWHVDSWLFSGTTDARLQDVIAKGQSWPWEYTVVTPSIDQFTSLDAWREQSPLLLAWRQISTPFEALFDPALTFSQFVYLLAGSLWSLAAWAVFGGAITRMAAVAFGRQENVSWKQLTGFVLPRWPAYVAAPLFPILGVIVLAAGLALVGLLLRSGPGVLAAGLLWPAVLFGGFLMAFLLIGLFFAWPLMWSTISTEGTDAFGALSHSYSYTYQRPLQYLMYGAAALVIGVLGFDLISLFAVWTLKLGTWGVSWGSGADALHQAVTQQEAGTLADTGARLIRFWNNCLSMLVVGFVFSYFWSASTVIYFLLRRLVDATEMDEVFTPEERALHSRPPLKAGPDGVAEPADDDPAPNHADSPGATGRA